MIAFPLVTRENLALMVRTIIADQELRQWDIAYVLDIDQSEVSKLMDGKHDNLFSIERLLSFLNKLGWDLGMVAQKKKQGADSVNR